MASTLDVFKSDAFKLNGLTASVSKIPFTPGRLGRLGLFEEQGVATTKVWIEQQAGELRLLPTTLRGAPATNYRRQRRDALEFEAPHIPYETFVLADEIQDVRAFGSQSSGQTVQQYIQERAAPMRRDLEATIEYHRVGALRGQILDADGSTIYDLHAEFGTTPNERTLGLGTDSTSVRTEIVGAARQMEDELGAMEYTGVRALCGRSFFDKLVSHPDVKEAYSRFQAGEMLRNDPRAGFPFAGVTFEEYRGKAPDGTPYIGDDEALMFPEGASGLFLTRFAPANFSETVNQPGLPIYAKLAVDPELNQWARLHIQSNPLQLVTRPRAVVQLAA